MLQEHNEETSLMSRRESLPREPTVITRLGLMCIKEEMLISLKVESWIICVNWEISITRGHQSPIQTTAKNAYKNAVNIVSLGKLMSWILLGLCILRSLKAVNEPTS